MSPLPQDATPPWIRLALDGEPTTEEAVGGELHIVINGSRELSYYRLFAPPIFHATMACRVKQVDSFAGPNDYCFAFGFMLTDFGQDLDFELRLGKSSGTKIVSLGGTYAAFDESPVDWTAYHTYRLTVELAAGQWVSRGYVDEVEVVAADFMDPGGLDLGVVRFLNYRSPGDTLEYRADAVKYDSRGVFTPAQKPFGRL